MVLRLELAQHPREGLLKHRPARPPCSQRVFLSQQVWVGPQHFPRFPALTPPPPSHPIYLPEGSLELLSIPEPSLIPSPPAARSTDYFPITLPPFSGSPPAPIWKRHLFLFPSTAPCANLHHCHHHFPLYSRIHCTSSLHAMPCIEEAPAAGCYS